MYKTNITLTFCAPNEGKCGCDSNAAADKVAIVQLSLSVNRAPPVINN
jgi:hypothetical protein